MKRYNPTLQANLIPGRRLLRMTASTPTTNPAAKSVDVWCLHALEESVGPTREAFARWFPDAVVDHVADYALSADAASGALSSDEAAERILAMAREATGRAAGGALLYTCSAFQDAIARCRSALREEAPALLILEPNEIAFREAASMGVPVHILVTFPPSLSSLLASFRRSHPDSAREARSHLVAGALEDLRSGRGEAHDAKVAAMAASVARSEGKRGVVLLGQFSEARAEAVVTKALAEARADWAVLTTPGSAVRYLRALLSPQTSGSREG